MSAKKKVYVDGVSGTVGGEIRGLLGRHPEIEPVVAESEVRRKEATRRKLMAAADAVVFCLPLRALEEALSLLPARPPKLLDASSAHRLDPDWVYGMPELVPTQRSRIREAGRVANPGCFASAFVLSVRPLREAGLLAPDARLACFATAGYSAGGRSFVERYESADSGSLRQPAVRFMYLDQKHRHIPEMRLHGALDSAPIFIPAIGAHKRGLLATVPIFPVTGADGGTARAILEEFYRDEPFIRVDSAAPVHVDPRVSDFSNQVTLGVVEHEEGMILTALLDNLGKGAAGAAVQNLNLMFGFEEATGL